MGDVVRFRNSASSPPEWADAWQALLRVMEENGRTSISISIENVRRIARDAHRLAEARHGRE